METNLLKTALRLNSAFSLITGTAILLFDSAIMSLIGIEQSLLFLGINLIGFAGLTYYASARNPHPKNLIWAIIVMDILWVMGSAIILIVPNSLSTAGNWMIAIVAIFVADFAYFQYKGLNKYTKHMTST